MATSIVAHPRATPNPKTSVAQPPRQVYRRYDLTVDAEAVDGALRRGIVPAFASISAKPQELAMWEVL